MTTIGYAQHGPHNGVGPFLEIFDKGESLITRDNLNGIDAILLWGGEDISPSLYNETPFHMSGPTEPSARDLFEWELMRQAKKKGIPIIGVCRGAQIMCAFAGGKLIQHTTGHSHYNWHDVTTHDGQQLNVSSEHHQMLYPFEVEHELLAWSTMKKSGVYQPDTEGYVRNMRNPAFEEPEVVYFPEINGYAIQCHPEWHHGEGRQFNKWVMSSILDWCYQKEN